MHKLLLKLLKHRWPGSENTDLFLCADILKHVYSAQYKHKKKKTNIEG